MALSREINKLLSMVSSFCDLSSFANPSKPQISANIICKDNIKSIELCLKSLVNCVDEIVVVDTGSSDGTLEILKKYNCKVIEHSEFKGYSYHRNEALKASCGDWIIVLDSDEFLSQELQNNLRDLVSTKIYSGYKLFRRWIDSPNTYIMTQKFKGRYKSIIRLFRKLPSVRYQGDIHEAVFGLEGKRIKKFPENRNTMYHVDVAINSLNERLEKVLKREELLPGSGHPEEYLPELFNIKKQLTPQEDMLLLESLNKEAIKQ